VAGDDLGWLRSREGTRELGVLSQPDSGAYWCSVQDGLEVFAGGNLNKRRRSELGGELVEVGG